MMDIRKITSLVSPRKLTRLFYQKGESKTIYGEVYEHSYSYFGSQQVTIRHLIQGLKSKTFTRFADLQSNGMSTFLIAPHADFPVGTLVEVEAEERTYITDRLFNNYQKNLYVISQKPITGEVYDAVKEGEMPYL